MSRSILLVLAMLSCATVAIDAQVVAERSLCYLAANAQASNGKPFTVKATYARTFHGAIVTDDTCASIKANVILADGYKASRSTMKLFINLANQGKQVALEFQATFRVAQKEQSFGQNCEPFQVEIEKIMSAAPADHVDGTGLSHEATGHAHSSPTP